MKITKRQLKKLIEEVGGAPRRGTEPSSLAYYKEMVGHLETALQHIEMAQQLEDDWSRVDADEDLDLIRQLLYGQIEAVQAMVTMGS